MHKHSFYMSFVAGLTLAYAGLALGGEVADTGGTPANANRPVGVVSFVKVLSNKIPDVSSLAAWKKSYIKDDMSEEQKAQTIWKSIWQHQYQDDPPYEFIHPEGHLADTMKIFNVYGYSYCGIATAHTETLTRYIGMQARGYTINRHVVPEIFHDNAWHLYDASLICYFPKTDGKAASVEEIKTAVLDWFATHPDLKGNDAKLGDFQKADNWQGWKRGPEWLVKSPAYSNSGWLPASTHGWYSTMQEYDGGGGTPFQWEPGYSTGYQVNNQLRKGEKLTRNWSNKGLHVNMTLKDRGEPGALKAKIGEGSFAYCAKAGDLAPGRVGNGTLEYNLPLADGSFRLGALTADNLQTKSEGAKAAVQVKDGAKDGVLVFRMPSSYVYLSGTLEFTPVVGKDGSVAVQFSDCNGNEWKDVGTYKDAAAQKVDLTALCFRRYDYQLRVTLKGAGTGLDALKVSHDIQHSQRPLPAFDQGENTLTFSAGPAEGTVTVEPTLNPGYKDKQVFAAQFKPELVNTALENGGISLKGASGTATFPIETPGEITRVRIESYYRSRNAADTWEYQVSFDGGKTFKSIGKTPSPGYGPTQQGVFGAVCTDVPAGAKKVLVRFAGTQNTVAILFTLRIDVDYKEPAGGFQPVKVTYKWQEAGQDKEQVFVAKKPDEVWKVNCAAKPLMKSIIFEWAE